MSSTNRAKKVFLDAVELSSAGREEFVREACGEDEALRVRVMKLLRAHENAEELFENSDRGAALDLTPAARDEEPIRPGAHIGSYRVVERVGEGGMGSVYLAEQEHPIVRPVAIKFVKLGMNTEQVVARFEAERQALAMMDHAGIAKVFDAGSTEDGRPYFVMEYVRGEPITRYANLENLSIRARLELFEQVCFAVQHAHQKSVIHRDLKPSNILVQPGDGRPLVKVIDFGIAKAAAPGGSEQGLTRPDQIIGTPEYMSPEQASTDGADADTRSDVYSLGVVLYELLAGLRPTDALIRPRASYAEILRVVLEEDPPKPSLCVIRERAETETAARQRGLSVRALSHCLRGDLDSIVMKCLEKDRERRYRTVGELADDIRRALDEKPVLATPPSLVYRLRKFVRRRKGVTVAASIAVLAFVLGAAGTVTGLISANAQARRADQEAIEATRQAAIAEAVNDFLNEDLLSAVVPSSAKGRGREVSMREVLDVASSRIDRASAPGGRFADEPLVTAAIRLSLGRTLTLLGEFDAARPQLEKGWQIRVRELGDDAFDTLDACVMVANLARRQGRLVEATTMLEEVLDRCREKEGDWHLVEVNATIQLASAARAAGEVDRAEELLHRSLDALADARENTPNVVSLRQEALSVLGVLYADEERYDEAEAVFRRRIDEAELHGLEVSQTLAARQNLAGLVLQAGRHDEAEPMLTELLEEFRRVFGPSHSMTRSCVHNLTLLYREQGRVDEARTLADENYEIHRESLGATHPETLRALCAIGEVHFDAGRSEEALEVFRESTQTLEATYGIEHPESRASRAALARALHERGDHEAAADTIAKLVEVERRIAGPTHPRTLRALANAARMHRQADRIDEAHRYAIEVYANTLAGFGRMTEEVDLELSYLVMIADRDQRVPHALEAIERSLATLDPSDEAGRARIQQAIDALRARLE